MKRSAIKRSRDMMMLFSEGGGKKKKGKSSAVYLSDY
jgi:hypothetical protein